MEGPTAFFLSFHSSSTFPLWLLSSRPEEIMFSTNPMELPWLAGWGLAGRASSEGKRTFPKSSVLLHFGNVNLMGFWHCLALTIEGAFVQNRAQACHACGERKWRRAGAVGEAGKADLLLISTMYLPEVVFTEQKMLKLLALSLCYGRRGKQVLTTPCFCLFWALLAMSHVAALSPQWGDHFWMFLCRSTL